VSRYNAVHGAQLITLDSTKADISFYAATDAAAANPLASQIDCYRINKAPGASVLYSACTQPWAAQYSLLTGALARNTATGRPAIAWR
jgi:hypothetical protein